MARLRGATVRTQRRAGLQVLPWGRGGHQVMRVRVPGHERQLGQRRLHVPLAAMRSVYGWSYDPQGWHPYTAGLREMLQAPDLPIEESVYYRYRATFRPRSAQSWLVPDELARIEPLASLPPRVPYRKYMWRLGPRSVATTPEPRDDGSPHADEVERRLRRRARERLAALLATYESIRDNGYRPELGDDHPISGFFLVDGDQERFVVLHGFHRCAALQAAGVVDAVVALHPTHPAVVPRAQLSRWTPQHGGLYPTSGAVRLFDAMFHARGLDKARRLGLV